MSARSSRTRDRRFRRTRRRPGIAGGAAELVLATLVERRAGAAGEAYRRGRAGTLMRAAKLTGGAGVALAAVAGRRSRLVSVVAGASLVAGSALTRFGVFEAGRQSADDPVATTRPQRERLDGGGGSADHAPAVTGPRA